MVAMATDIRVILIKLADRLHNMRTIDAMPKQKQLEKARETLEIYAPLAHRLGIHAIKWELEDLAFATLHPRKYQEIKALVAQQRDERERYVAEAGEYLSARARGASASPAQIAGRAKHFYSIYSKMTRKGREFNEIYDLTAMRVIVESVTDCYGAVGVIHSLWKPLPGRFKDFIAMPKFNMYQSLHTTVIGPEGRPLEIQIRTREMHEIAEFGVAAHWVYKHARRGDGSWDGRARTPSSSGCARCSTGRRTSRTRASSWRPSRSTSSRTRSSSSRPRARSSSLAAGATPLDFAYEVHTEIGHRCVGARVNGKIVPLPTSCDPATSSRSSPPSASAAPRATGWRWSRRRARATRSSSGSRPSRARTPSTPGASCCRSTCAKQGLPAQKIAGSALLADVIREVGYPQGRRLLHRARRREDLAEDSSSTR